MSNLAEKLPSTSGQVRWFAYGIAQDISERYEIDRMKDEFIGIVSHELRTPMTAIQSSLTMLTAGTFDDDPEQSAQMLRIAQTNTDRLVRLVNDILDLERLESGKVQLIPEPCSIADLMQAAIDTLQPLATKTRCSSSGNPTRPRSWSTPTPLSRP
jgi:signal transduction histidine kinase